MEEPEIRKRTEQANFFVSVDILPQTRDILITRAEPLGIELLHGDHRETVLNEDFFGCILQYPAKDGMIFDYTSFISTVHEKEIKVVVAADILSLAILKSPAEMGADVAVGTTQRFGIPLGFGGPHAAFFATHEEYKRLIPGRIIGVTIDADGNRALRMALQTREQHIKEKRPHQISVLLRRCWQLWLVCMQCITEERASNILQDRFILWPIFWTRLCSN